MTNASTDQLEGRADRRSEALWRTGIVTALIVAFLYQSIRQFRVIREGTNGYLIGDWTIYYAGGFVRRGLFGWLLTTLGPDATSALNVLWVIQTTLYVVIFGVVIAWALVLPEPSRWSLLLLSPAFLMFGFNDFSGTHRKEIIALAGLVLLAESVRQGRGVIPAVVVATFLLVIAVFSHEANALLVGPFVFLLREARKATLVTPRAQLVGSITFIGVALAGIISALVAPGTLDQQQLICADLVMRGFEPNLCAGSLAYIGESASTQIVRVGRRFPAYALYGLSVLFASIPFALTPFARRHRRVLLLTIAPITPLFFIATDWGRWIMLATFMCTALVITGASREGLRPERVSALLIVMFITAWSMPHFDINTSDMGPGNIPGLVLSTLEQLQQLISQGRFTT